MKRPRVWTVADFATHAGLSHRSARRLLKRLDFKWNGELLQPSEGENRGYTFYPAVLARLEPDLFTPVESLEFRIEELEERDEEMRRQIRLLAQQTGQNSRAISKHGEQLKLFKRTG